MVQRGINVTTRLVAIGWILTFALPAIAAGQSPAGSFDTLDQQLKPGQQVIVTEAGGRRAKGRLLDVDGTGLTLLVDEGYDERSLTISAANVSTIRKNDSLLNGFLIGLGAGLAGGEIWVYNVCGPRGYDDECRAIATPIGWAAFGGGGAVIGTLIDKFTTRLVYQAPDGRARLHVRPVVARTQQGVRVSWSF
jgi:hypothetical protein